MVNTEEICNLLIIGLSKSEEGIRTVNFVDEIQVQDLDVDFKPRTLGEKLRLIWKTIVFVGLTALLLWLWQSSMVRLTKNFYEIDPGKFYRSAQLSPGELKEAIHKYGIKTVISLRGAPENSYWVKPQVKALEEENVKFYSFGWTSDYFPDTEEFKNYLKTLKTADYPILVHCRTGADRTGEATAMYAIDFMHMPKDEAIEKYLNWHYWHFEMFHPAKKEFVRKYPGIDQALQSYDACSPENKQWAHPGRCQ